MKTSLVVVAGVALLARLQAQQAPSTRELTLTVEPVTAPAAGSSSEPQMTTQGGKVMLSWLELGDDRVSLKFSERSASGWTEARTAASGADFMVNEADVPSVRRLADGSIVAQWLQEDGPDPEAYKLRLSWSKDDGRTWSPSITAHRDTVQTQHGFASLFQAPGAGLGLVWLDGRAVSDAPDGAGNMQLRAATFDASGKLQKESVVASRVCECCPTAAAETADSIVVAYRGRSTREVRDVFVTRLVNGQWAAPVAVHNDGWVIEACPVNGPAISARGATVAVAWFTGVGGTGHAYVAFSRDGGKTFAAPVRLDQATALGRVGVTFLADGSAVGTWVEFASGNKPSAFMARRVDSQGRRGDAVRIADSGGMRQPRVAAAGNEVLFAWTSVEGGTRVRTARAVIR